MKSSSCPAITGSGSTPKTGRHGRRLPHHLPFPVPGGAVITGSEVVKTWEPYQGDVWVARIPNGLFGNYNPYTTLIEGDWYIPSKPFHTGEVYLNGKSMYEAEDLEGVLQPQEYKSSWDRAFTIYRWYTCQEDGNTVLYANFHGSQPQRGERGDQRAPQLLLPQQDRRELHHPLRLCGAPGGHPVGPSHLPTRKA